MNTNYIRIIAVLAYVILAPILGAFFDGLDRKISARMLSCWTSNHTATS